MAGARGPVTSGPAGHHGERLGPRLTGRKEACRCPVSVGPAGVAGLGRAHLPVVVGWGLRHSHHRRGGSDNTFVLSRIWGLRSPRSRRRPMRSPARALVLACRWPASPCVPTRQGAGVPATLPVLIKALIPSWGPLLPTASDPSRLPKPPPTFWRAARAPVDAKTESLTPFAHRRSLAAVSRHWAHGDRGTMAATPSQSSTHLGREHTQARPARTGEPRARGCSGAAQRQARGSWRAQGLRWPNGVHSRP